MNHDKQYAIDKYNADALLHGFSNTDICVFMYYPAEKRIEVPIGFAIVDVDHFKMANDTFGHEMGDRILTEITFLRVNPAFYTEFDLDEDLRPAMQIFQKQLTAGSYSGLVQAFEQSVEGGGKALAPIIWNGADGKRRKYVCQIAYEGSIGGSAAIVAVFTRITDEVQAFDE